MHKVILRRPEMLTILEEIQNTLRAHWNELNSVGAIVNL